MKLAAEDGDILWMKLIGGADGLDDCGWAIVVGPDGNPIATGITTNGDGTADYVTFKLNGANGSTIWSRTLPGANNNISERAGWLAMCDNGDVVMANRTWTPSSSYDVVLHRYAAGDGQTVWAIQHGSPGSSPDNPRAMVRDAVGHLLVAGVGSGNFLVLKFDSSNGDLIWSSAYDGPAHGYDAANCIIEGPKGEVIACGFSTGVGTSWDFTTVGFAPVDGSTLWEERFDTGDSQAEEAGVLAVSPMNDLYVVGYGYTIATDSDLLSLRYFIDATASVQEDHLLPPAVTASPNPFSRAVSLTIEAADEVGSGLRIYDLSGRLVRRLAARGRAGGRARVSWDGRDDSGLPLRAGVYIARIERGGTVGSRKVVLVR